MTFYELQQVLKRYGTIIYTRDRLADLELMEEELRELKLMGLIDDNIFREGILVLRQETRIQRTKEK